MCIRDRINGVGTRVIAEGCRSCRAKLLYISTDYVFNGEKGSAYTESDLPQPLNVYGGSKLKGEEDVRTLVPESLIVRTSWLFGRYGKNFVATIIEKAKQNKQLQVVDDQRGSPTSTMTLAEAIKRLLPAVFFGAAAEAYGIYHVSNSGNCSWYEFAKTIVACADLPAEVVPVDSGTVNRPAKRPRLSILDTGRYEKLTGDKLSSWRDALNRYLADCG
jgi:dTDP-4-dehydrorhamnose reductase